ncbi:UNVERIFIED_CONTAM: hypothetical protein NCL1_20625 [Trichonephila clavipes]
MQAALANLLYDSGGSITAEMSSTRVEHTDMLNGICHQRFHILDKVNEILKDDYNFYFTVIRIPSVDTFLSLNQNAALRIKMSFRTKTPKLFLEGLYDKYT